MSARVSIIGGGIAGLATAYRLVAGEQGEQQVPDVTVLESDGSAGGKMRSVEVGGLSLEAGPDSLLARKPWGVELCRELGLEGELVAPATGSTHIWSDAGLLPFPSGPFGISTDPNELWHWPGMTRRGKLRAIGDVWRRARKGTGDESLGSLIRRRVGDEACDRLVAPLLGGLFAGDVDRLSVQATFPELAAWERSHGSLIRGARAAAKASEESSQGKKLPPMFLRLRGGFQRLTDALVGSIGPEHLRCGKSVESIRREGGGYLVRAGETEIAADCVVLASPAFVTADLLEDLAPGAASELRRIPYLSTAVVLLVYAEGTGPSLPDSSGFVVPRGKAAMTAATLVSRKWPDEAFGERAVVRCFVGGAGAEDLLEESDEDIVEGVCRQLAGVLPLPARPEAARVVRWPSAMPQYEVGHLDRVTEIERALPPGVFVVGQAYRGAGIPDCVRAAGEVAVRVRSHLAGDVERETVG
jgi:oxygen-dependent protoporphyrinogen oxidase